MANQVQRRETEPRRGLESWLPRKIQLGNLKALPPYYAPRARAVDPPEQYAQKLLAGLRDGAMSDWERELTRDDGRAFRSWVEANLGPESASPVFS